MSDVREGCISRPTQSSKQLEQLRVCVATRGSAVLEGTQLILEDLVAPAWIPEMGKLSGRVDEDRLGTITVKISVNYTYLIFLV